MTFSCIRMMRVSAPYFIGMYHDRLASWTADKPPAYAPQSSFVFMGSMPANARTAVVLRRVHPMRPCRTFLKGGAHPFPSR